MLRVSSQRLRSLLPLLLLLAGGSSPSLAGLVGVVNDRPGFEATANSRFLFAGLEGFEDNTLSSGSMNFGSGLSDTSTNSPFPNGLGVPVTISSNSGLTATKNTGGVMGTVVGNRNRTNSLVLTFAEEDQVAAVGFSPVTPLSGSARFDVTVSLFDGANLSLTLNPVSEAGTGYFGVLTELGDSPIQSIILGVARINGMTTDTNNGLDNLTVFTAVPEPTAFGVLGAVTVLGAVSISRRRRF